MLQTDPKESLALTLLLALQVSGAAVGIPSYPLLVEELLQLQLKHARAQNLAGEYGETDSQEQTQASHCVDSPSKPVKAPQVRAARLKHSWRKSCKTFPVSRSQGESLTRSGGGKRKL